MEPVAVWVGLFPTWFSLVDILGTFVGLMSFLLAYVIIFGERLFDRVF
jgi:hypothetical protein